MTTVNARRTPSRRFRIIVLIPAIALLAIVMSTGVRTPFAAADVADPAPQVCETTYSGDVAHVDCVDTETEVATVTERATRTATQTETATATATETEIATETATQTETATETAFETQTATATQTATVVVPTTLTVPAIVLTTIPATVFATVPATEPRTATVTGVAQVGGTRPVFVTDQAPFTAAEQATSTHIVDVTRWYADRQNPQTGETPALSLSASSVGVGESITVTMSGFTPDETIQVWLHSTPVMVGETVADATGSAQLTVTIPVGTEIGSHTIDVVGLTCGVTASAPLTVVANPTAAATQIQPFDINARSLSYTGVDTGQSVGFAVALIATGLTVTLLARRMRRPGQTGQHRA